MERPPERQARELNELPPTKSESKPQLEGNVVGGVWGFSSLRSSKGRSNPQFSEFAVWSVLPSAKRGNSMMLPSSKSESKPQLEGNGVGGILRFILPSLVERTPQSPIFGNCSMERPPERQARELNDATAL